ncbi:MAG: formylglycine-generating enzyme family protein [Pseudomonadota bacterium]
MSKPCCSPARGGIAAPAPEIAKGAPPDLGWCDIPGGTALIGTDHPGLPADEEGPLRRKRLKPFAMMAGAVTNAQFSAFVEATGYTTDAERFGWSFVFQHHVHAAAGATQRVVGTEWWHRIDGAQWRRPDGPGGADADPDHPAVHISWTDARAFAAWAGGRLPTEAEWEHAARGGLGDVPFVWGDAAPDDDSFQPCNIWQGRFPDLDTGRDGYIGTAPVRSFAPNGYGLFNMLGNVWEWTSEPARLRSLSKAKRAAHHWPPGAKLLKGGSFLCHRSYCFRYRIAARTGNTPDTGTAHQGFRLVRGL